MSLKKYMLFCGSELVLTTLVTLVIGLAFMSLSDAVEKYDVMYQVAIVKQGLQGLLSKDLT